MSEKDQDPPRWIPYSAPPANGWDKTRDFFRQMLFPGVLLLFGLGIWGGLYWLSHSQDKVSSVNVQVSPAENVSEASIDTATGAVQLTVRSRPEGASVWINGDSVGTTPLSAHTLEPGVYFLSVRSPGYLSVDTVATLSRGTSPEMTFSLQSRPGDEPSPATTGALAEQTQEEDQEEAAVPEEPPADEEEEAPSSSSPTTEPPASEQTPSEEETNEEFTAPETGTLHITSDPNGAIVLVDGTPRGQTPLTLEEVPVGSYDVTLQSEGHEPWSTTVSAEADVPQDVHGRLEPLSGQLRVLAQPWGTIYIDDSLHARESDIWYETELPVGQHQIRVVHPSLGEQTRVVEVQSGEANELVINLREDDPETQS